MLVPGYTAVNMEGYDPNTIKLILLKMMFMKLCTKVKRVEWLVKNLCNIKNCLCNMIIAMNKLGIEKH